MSVMTEAGISVQPLSDAPLGALVYGLDAAKPLTPELSDALMAAWREHLVLIARDQELSDQQLIDFSRNFGELDPPGPNPYGEPFLADYPDINVISNVVEGGRPIGNLGDGEAVWHADMTYVDIPPKGAVLYALEVPDEGGDTYFANMFAAYEALSPDLKARIEGLSAIHDAAHNSAGMLRKGYEEVTDVRKTPGARHPLVRTDPVTGRKCLFLGRRPHAYVVGLEVEESDALLDELWAHVADPRFAMAHHWREGDLLMWLNLCVLHRRDAFDPTTRRVMHRTQIKGEEAIA
ncbi:MAG TPA: TauD/TfdA family dioxygenase [Alphaproteobacteria bacterium]|nr:TauD/TfdA family dioxygenase [Alphaproteobacteria bacterium]